MNAELIGTEILSLRTEHGKVYQTGPQRYRSVTYLDTIHYLDEKTGEYRLIDNRLEQREDSVQNRDNPTLQVEMTAESIAVHNAKGAGLKWTLLGAAPRKPEIEERKDCEELDQIRSAAIYREILPEADMRCEISGVHFKEEVIFHTREAVREIIYEVSLNGLGIKQQEENLYLVDESGEPAFVLPAPVCMDSSRDSEPAPLTRRIEWDRNRNRIRMLCRLSEEWLAQAEFPVTLDPTVVTYNARCAIDDAYTCSKAPNTIHKGSSSNILRLTKGSSNWGQCHCFFQFDDTVLPVLDTSDYIISAVLSVATAQSGYPTSSFSCTLHEVTGSWSPDTLTHNNMPSYAGEALDHSYFSAGEGEGRVHGFDITNLVRKWYTGTNNGVMLKAESNTYAQLRSSAFGQTDEKRPLVIIEYISKAGIENYLSYEDQQIGRGGVGHVSLFNGNLIFEHADTETSGSMMPVSISHVYNSCWNEQNPMGAGYGWKLNLQQAIRKETISNTLYYAWVDEDGTEVYFYQQDGKWKDQIGREMELTFNGSEACIENKQGLKRFFETPTSEYNGNWANAKPLRRIENALGQQIALNGSGFSCAGIQDAAGRTTSVTWLNGSVSTVRAPGMTQVLSYQYVNDCLLRIIHEDQAYTVYTYDSRHLLTGIRNIDGVTALYGYTSRPPYRVLSAKISRDAGSANEKVLYHHTYDYADSLTIVTDMLSGKKIRYHFDDSGRLVALTDELGYGAFSRYSVGGALDKPEAISRLQRSTRNLLRDPMFGAEHTWNTAINSSAGSFEYTTVKTYMGGRCMHIRKTADGGNLIVYQGATLTPGKTYTLSAYCQTAGASTCQLLGYIQNGSSPRWIGSEKFTCGETWTRIHYTFTLSATDGTELLIALGAMDGVGEVWLTGAQLEEGVIPNHVNLISNGSFTAGGSDWSGSGSVVTVSGDSTLPEGLGSTAMQMTGSGQALSAVQTIVLNGQKDDVYVAGGWSRACSTPRKGVHERYSLQVSFYDGGSWQTRDDGYVEWSEEWSGWHMAAVPIIAPCNYSQIRVTLYYSYNYNTALFTGLFLHREEYGNSFAYDSKGNLQSTRDLASQQDHAVYDDYNNLTEYRQAGRAESVKTVLSYGSTEEEKKRRLLKKTVSPLGITTDYTHDERGNVTETAVYQGTLRMVTSTGYSTDGNYALTQTDARGKTVVRDIDPNLGTVRSVTDPKGQTVHYTYDVLKRVTQTETVADGKSYRNQNTYTDDRLTQVKHNTSDDPTEDVAYNFEYDSLGRATAVKVGTQPLSTTAYNTDGTTASVTYGNGGQVRYGYDAFKRLTDVSFDEEGRVRYHYLYGNNGETAQVTDSALGTTIRSEYDLANRPMRKTTTGANGVIYTAEVSYDQYSNLAGFKERVAGGQAYETDYEYDAENKPARIAYSDGSEVRYVYDELGRVIQRIVSGSSGAQETEYTYLAGANGNTTPLIRQIRQLGERTVYTYDEVGNILSVSYPDLGPGTPDPVPRNLHTEDGEALYPSTTSETVTGYAPVYDGNTAMAKRVKDDSHNPVSYGQTMEQDTLSASPIVAHADGRQSNRISYQYDAQGQLIRVNDPVDPTAGVSGTTWVYSYDQGGNILIKAAYSFTEEETITGTAVYTGTYTYGNANWKDQLTAYNDVPITYDAIGNPLTDGTWTYTWQHGRQLASMSKDGEAVSFVYNEDGLRVQKTATSTGVTKYTLHGKNIVHLTNGNDELHFFYDAQGRVAVVDFNGTAYRYVHNLQGDVVALIDAEGNRVVEYWYDAWGKPLSKTGSMAETLGTVQPFRYRGYVWDEETELYYLRCRYYNPSIARFLIPDGGVEGLFTIGGLNKYAYCMRSPISMADSDGKSSTYVLYYYFEGSKTPLKEEAEHIPYSIHSSDLVLQPIKTSADFVEIWNSIEDDVDDIYLYLHGGKGYIQFADSDDRIYASGENSSIGKSLKSLSVSGTIYDFTCSGAACDEFGNSVASELAKLTGAPVVACDTGVSYRFGFPYNILYGTNWYARARTSEANTTTYHWSRIKWNNLLNKPIVSPIITHPIYMRQKRNNNVWR